MKKVYTKDLQVGDIIADFDTDRTLVGIDHFEDHTVVHLRNPGNSVFNYIFYANQSHQVREPSAAIDIMMGENMSVQEEKIRGLEYRIAVCNNDIDLYNKMLFTAMKSIVRSKSLGQQLEDHNNLLFCIKSRHGAESKKNYLKGCLEFEQSKD
jgi:hypothetical protein